MTARSICPDCGCENETWMSGMYPIDEYSSCSNCTHVFLTEENIFSIIEVKKSNNNNSYSYVK